MELNSEKQRQKKKLKQHLPFTPCFFSRLTFTPLFLMCWETCSGVGCRAISALVSTAPPPLTTSLTLVLQGCLSHFFSSVLTGGFLPFLKPVFPVAPSFWLRGSALLWVCWNQLELAASRQHSWPLLTGGHPCSPPCLHQYTDIVCKQEKRIFTTWTPPDVYHLHSLIRIHKIIVLAKGGKGIGLICNQESES